MVRVKFKFKRQRLNLDEDYDFNFGSDNEEDVATTAASVAAVELPEEKLSITGTLQSSGKLKRKTQSQWNMPQSKSSVGFGLKPWESWLGKMESPQRRSPSPVSRLTASVVETRRDVSPGLSMWSSSSVPKCANNLKVLDKPPTRAGKVPAVDRPKLLVMRGDPTDWSTEAIVSDTNSLLHHNCGLTATILNKGGLEIQRQCRQWVYYNGEVPVGSAMWTTAGKLSSRIIIHTVGPDVSYHRCPTPRHQQELRQAVRSALSLADDLDVASVAIPALCTGVSRYPKYLAAREIVAECLEYCDDYPFTALRLIVFMNEDEVATSAFVQAMKDAREQRQQERQWASAVEMPEGIQTFGGAFDSSSDESSESSEMQEPRQEGTTDTMSGWTV